MNCYRVTIRLASSARLWGGRTRSTVDDQVIAPIIRADDPAAARARALETFVDDFETVVVKRVELLHEDAGTAHRRMTVLDPALVAQRQARVRALRADFVARMQRASEVPA